MKIGDYVRTNNGTILRINEQWELDVIKDEYREEFKVKKISLKPIKLIEVGDIVNGYKITTIGSNKIYAEDEEGYLIKEFGEKNIKTILTHEQYKIGAYKVEKMTAKRCKYCKGKGLIQIGKNLRGLKECPYCKGKGTK